MFARGARRLLHDIVLGFGIMLAGAALGFSVMLRGAPQSGDAVLLASEFLTKTGEHRGRSDI